MPSEESRKRCERRRHQRWRERWMADPEIQVLRRVLEARRRYRQRHPFTGYAERPEVRGHMLMHCISAGVIRGGRPPQARRCTKRLGTRYCWNWQARGADRCHLHPRTNPPG
jgi:hypothetical protein